MNCPTCSTTSSRSPSPASPSGAVYALVALGYTLVYGVLRLINFAHSEVFMYGTFAALWARHGARRPARQRAVASVGLLRAGMLVAAMVMSGVIAARRSSGSPTGRCASATPRRWSR